MYFSSPTSNITPAMTSVAMSRSDSRDSTSSNTSHTYTVYAPNSAYSALLSASPSSSWPISHTLTRSDSDVSTGTTSQSMSFSQSGSVAMRRDSSNSSWLPSPYRSCMSSFGSEPSSYLSDDDLLSTPENLPPVETIPALSSPKKELTTEEQIAFLRELQEKEAAHRHRHAHSHSHQQSEPKRKVVRFAAGAAAAASQDEKARRPSTPKRRQPSIRRGLTSLNGPQ
ncbi:hypothetical protein PV11_03148 [Exophiala sideris]|uniref:Uncharacterized protein n=1 Tax=Exophiala sideris TaxID=1016849 RepID=A0A0D1Z179_9EURO|nr:hypothetical protein PV11_03148 [Exophiala sideris]